MHVAPPLRLAAAAGFLAMVAALFVGGSQPGAGGLFEPPWDKLVHFAYFAALATLAMVATDLRRPGLVFIAVVIVGVADELAQTQLPGRHADLPDLAMDVIGALAAVVVLASARRRVFARLAGR